MTNLLDRAAPAGAPFRPIDSDHPTQGWLRLASLRPIAGARQNGRSSRLLELDRQLVQSGTRPRRLKAQQVATVQVIGEIVQPRLKALARIEHLVFPAALRSDS